MPSPRQLEYLIALAEERHFRRAAEKLGVSQPTLSMQLRALEEQLGAQLIERGRNATLLTPVGEQAVEIGKRVLRDLQDIRELARSTRGPMGGSLRLGLPPTIGPHLLPLMLPRMHREHPELKLYVREEMQRPLVEALVRGRHDVLLVPIPVHGSDLETQPIFREPIHVAVADDHPLAGRPALAREDLRGERVLTLERGHHLQEQVEALCHEFGADLMLDYGGTSLDTLSQMVAMGTGISFLPGLYVERVLRRQPGVTVLEFRGRSMARTIGAVWRAASARRDDYLMLARLVRETVAEHFPRFPLL